MPRTLSSKSKIGFVQSEKQICKDAIQGQSGGGKVEAEGIQLERQWVNIYLGQWVNIYLGKQHYNHPVPPVWTCSMHTSENPCIIYVI